MGKGEKGLGRRKSKGLKSQKVEDSESLGSKALRNSESALPSDLFDSLDPFDPLDPFDLFDPQTRNRRLGRRLSMRMFREGRIIRHAIRQTAKIAMDGLGVGALCL